jgi:hypothetical protein
MIQTDKYAMLTLQDLARHCAEETDHYYHSQKYDPQYCFEIFRRAIIDRDQFAWEIILSQYQPLVLKWVNQHPGFLSTGEEDEYFINRAFEKIWIALTPEKFSKFTALASLLSYLKMCVHSVITDQNRARQFSAVEAAASDRPQDFQASEDSHLSIEDQALEQDFRQHFWQSIQTRLQDEKEQRVVYDSFFLALKPREIQKLAPNLFTSVEEVYLIKQNILARFRRDDELNKLISQSD